MYINYLVLLVLLTTIKASAINLKISNEAINAKNVELFNVVRSEFRNASSFLSCLLVDVEDFSLGVKTKNTDQFCPSVISYTGCEMTARGGKLVSFPTHVFFFARTHVNVEEKVISALNQGFYKPRIPTLIILMDEVENLDFLPGFMMNLWRLKIYRFIVVLFHENIRVFAYDPFRNIVINITDISIIFTNKEFSNLHRYKIRLVLFHNPPESYKKEGEWYGAEKHFWTMLLGDLNATFKVVETPPYRLNEAKRAVKSGLGDVCPMRYFRTDAPDDLEFSQPYYVERLVVMVPYSRKLSHTPIGFQKLVWCSITIAMVALSISILSIGKVSPTAGGSAMQIVLDVYGVSVGRSIVNRTYLSYNWLQKGLLVLWQMENVVLIAAFQYGIISTLLLAKYDDQIDTLKDLINSNLTVYVVPEYIRMVRHYVPSLKDQIVNLPRSAMFDLLGNQTLNHQALVLPESESRLFVARLNANGEPRYRVMQESLVPGFFSFFFTRNSPFITMINRKVLEKYQFGLNRNLKFKRMDVQSRSTRNSYTPLSLEHMETVFGSISIMLIFSVFLFLVEILVALKRKKIRQL